MFDAGKNWKLLCDCRDYLVERLPAVLDPRNVGNEPATQPSPARAHFTARNKRLEESLCPYFVVH